MVADRIVKGVFLSLGTSRDDLQRRSARWWVCFVIVIGFSLSIIGGLIVLALTSYSRLGIPVVVTTFGYACTVLAVYAVQKREVTSRRLTRRMGRLLLIGVCGTLFLLAFPVAAFAVPSSAFSLWSAVTVGGLTLGFLMVLVYDGHPRLKARGSPGYIAEAGLFIVSAIIYMTAVSYWIAPFNPTQVLEVEALLPPGSTWGGYTFPLGTTFLGQDLLSRVLTGGAIMLEVAVLSVTVCFSVGVPIALASSFRGGLVDRGVCLVMDSVYAFPGLVLAIAIAAMLGQGVVNMALAIAVVYIPSYFRVVRSQVLTVKELPYVEAAVAMGARTRDILFRYILPNVLPSAVVVMSINFADAILTEAGLTFVGLGFPINVSDWGLDLTLGRPQVMTGVWWVITYPGLMIVILALGFTLAGEGFNEILTPRLRE